MPMQIFRVGSRPSAKGPGDYFTGDVRIDTLFGPDEPGRTSGALVTFEPGAATTASSLQARPCAARSCRLQHEFGRDESPKTPPLLRQPGSSNPQILPPTQRIRPPHR